MDQEKWDRRYLKMAVLVAEWSKDPNAQVGAVIVRSNRVIATGFNGFPTEVLDDKTRLDDKDIKLEMVVHAEENALIVAGRSAEGGTIYVHGKPVCPRCAGSIIQAGIKRVVAMRPKADSDSKWDRLGQIAQEMFAEAGVQFHAKAHVAETAEENPAVKADGESKKSNVKSIHPAA